MSDPIGVAVDDDREIVRRGPRDLLEADDVTVVEEAVTADEARRRIPSTHLSVPVLRWPTG